MRRTRFDATRLQSPFIMLTKVTKVIASLSLGAPRTFIMTPAGTSSGKGRSSLQRKRSAPSTSNATNMDEKPKPEPHKWVLANGSLLIMRGSTQQLWKVSLHVGNVSYPSSAHNPVLFIA